MIGSHRIRHWSKQQTAVALSSAEAELYAMNRGGIEAMGLQQLCREMGIEMGIRVYTDASATKGIINRKGSGKLKHIQTNQFWLQSKLAEGVLKVEKVNRVDNPADILTHHWSGSGAVKLFKLIALDVCEKPVERQCSVEGELKSCAKVYHIQRPVDDGEWVHLQLDREVPLEVLLFKESKGYNYPKGDHFAEKSFGLWVMCCIELTLEGRWVRP